MYDERENSLATLRYLPESAATVNRKFPLEIK